jgi:hypothetical protein
MPPRLLRFDSSRRPAGHVRPYGIRRAALLGSLLAAACSGPPGAGRQLGEDLGTFHVEASEALNTCGAGSLGSQASFDFEVELSRADSELFWDGRIGGEILASLEFEFSAEISVILRPPRAPRAGCVIARQDRISGALRPDATGAIATFAGTMRYSFAQPAATDCTIEEQQSAGLTLLPCSMSYGLTGQRTRAPERPPEAPAER